MRGGTKGPEEPVSVLSTQRLPSLPAGVCDHEPPILIYLQEKDAI